jgi:hypothetical protein
MSNRHSNFSFPPSPFSIKAQSSKQKILSIKSMLFRMVACRYDAAVVQWRLFALSKLCGQSRVIDERLSLGLIRGDVLCFCCRAAEFDSDSG